MQFSFLCWRISFWNKKVGAGHIDIYHSTPRAPTTLKFSLYYTWNGYEDVKAYRVLDVTLITVGHIRDVCKKKVNDLLNFTHFKESGKAGLKV